MMCQGPLHLRLAILWEALAFGGWWERFFAIPSAFHRFRCAGLHLYSFKLCAT